MQLLEDRELDVLEPQPGRAVGGAGLLLVAWQRRALVLLGLVIGLVLGALYYLERPAVFQSSAQVLVARNQPNIMQVPGADGSRVTMIEDYLTTHSNLFKSEVIQKRAAELLRSDPPPGVPEGTDFVPLIAAGLNIVREKDQTTGAASNILALSFRCPYQQACPHILEAIIAGYRNFVDDTQGRVTSKTVKILKDYLKVVETDLAGKEKLYWSKKRTPRAREDLANLQANITAYEAKRTALRMRLKEIQVRLQGADALLKQQGISRKSVAAMLEGNQPNATTRRETFEGKNLEETIQMMELQEMEMADRLGKDHPERVALRRRLKVARDLLAKQNGTTGGRELDALDLVLGTLKQEAIEAEQQLTELDKWIADEKHKAEPLEFEVRQDEAERMELDRLKKTAEDLGAKLKPLDLTELSTVYNIDEVTKPKPAVKVAPNLPQSLLLAGVIGIAFGVCLAYLAELTDKSFRSPEDIRKRLGLPVIGHIPPIVAPPAVPGPDLDPMLAAFHKPRGIEAEAYRGVRTSLYFSAQSQGHKIIQVTSPNAADGKSTLAANLAVSVARSGKRVALVDADFRKPRVHRLFHMEDVETGLAQVIAGESDLDTALMPCAAVPGLWLLPCGPRPANPAELLTSPQFQDVLEQMRDRFDLVLVDTPPLLAVSDPSVVAPRVDGVILTIRVTKNGRPAAERAKEVLTSLGARILGVVVNGFAGASTAYGYYAYYQSPYHYEDAHNYIKDDDEPPQLPAKSR